MNSPPLFFSCLECSFQVQGPTSGLGIVSGVLLVECGAVRCLPLRMARSGAMALWCQTVMSRVQGNTINTMARISLLFGISRIGYLARHYLGTRTDENDSVSKGQKSRKSHEPLTGTNCCGRCNVQVLQWWVYGSVRNVRVHCWFQR